MKNRLPCRIACLTSLVVFAAGAVACNGNGEVPAPAPERTSEVPDVVPREALEAMTMGEIIDLGRRRLRWEEDRRPAGTKDEVIEWFLTDQELREWGDWGWDLGYLEERGYRDD